MKLTEVRHSTLGENLYDLWVDGKIQVYGESLRIVEGIQDSLKGESLGEYGELDEVADSIL